DGIRDFHVTGVQTCALPICQNFRQSYAFVGEQFPTLWVSDYKRDPNGNVVVDRDSGDPLVATDNVKLGPMVPPHMFGLNIATGRSEERRVGKYSREQ